MAAGEFCAKFAAEQRGVGAGDDDAEAFVEFLADIQFPAFDDLRFVQKERAGAS